MSAPATRWWRVAVAVAARRSASERGGLLVCLGFHVVVTVTLSGVWRAAIAGRGGTIAGYSATAITWYVATTEACTVSLYARLIADLGADIASGAIASELLRPRPVLAVRVASEVGRVLPRLALCLASAAVLCTVTVGGPPRPLALLLVPAAAVLAVTVNVVAQHAFGAMAFWLRDAGSAWLLYTKLVFVLGGMLLPIQTMPGWMHTLAAVLPFSAMAYAPARLAAGHLEPWLLLVQLGWLVVLGALAARVFAVGERRLQVVGG